LQYCAVIPAGDELYHHGVKGMHWGVRRYQNENGSLTSAGRARMNEWKQKEIARRDKGYYKVEKKLDKKAAKLLLKRSKLINKKKNTDKIDEKIAKNATNLKINNALQKAEVKKIKSMKLKDIHQAKINKAKYATKQTLKFIGKTALATAGVAASGGIALGTSTNIVTSGGKLLLGGGKTLGRKATEAFIKKAAIKGAIGGAAAIGLAGGSVTGEVKSISTALGSKKRFSNLSANERSAIIEKYLKKKK